MGRRVELPSDTCLSADANPDPGLVAHSAEPMSGCLVDGVTTMSVVCSAFHCSPARWLPVLRSRAFPSVAFGGSADEHFVTVEEQWIKLENIVETARRVWG
jgi:hypothetical protein